MLIFKQAVNRQKTALFLSKAAIKRRKVSLFLFSQSGDKVARIDTLQSDDKARKNTFKQARISNFIPC
jgi:hypothetical protein